MGDSHPPEPSRPSDLAAQVDFWNRWNQERSGPLWEGSRREAEVVTGWLRQLGRTDLDILDVGCGTAWLEPLLTPFGHVTATDLADEWIRAARARQPDVTFLTGDFVTIDLPESGFDAVVSLEVLAHVADQPAFVRRAASLLRPGGRLMLATQNRPVLEHLNDVDPPGEGQLRKWVDRHQLRALLEDDFEVLELFTVTPRLGRVMKLLSRTRLAGSAKRVVTDAAGDTKPRTGAGWRLLERVGLGATLMCHARRR